MFKFYLFFLLFFPNLKNKLVFIRPAKKQGCEELSIFIQSSVPMLSTSAWWVSLIGSGKTSAHFHVLRLMGNHFVGRLESQWDLQLFHSPVSRTLQRDGGMVSVGWGPSGSRPGGVSRGLCHEPVPENWGRVDERKRSNGTYDRTARASWKARYMDVSLQA